MAASLAVSRTGRSSNGDEADELARLFRATRLTVLVGPVGVGKSTLLTGELPARLLRRRDDRARAGLRREGIVTYLPDRRAGATARDITILLDCWDQPLRALSERIDAVLHELFGTPPDALVPEVAFGWLAEKLRAHGERLNVRFLIVLDGFDAFLAAPTDDPAVALFRDELLESLETPDVPAHFLVAVRDASSSAFERFRARLVAASVATMRLAGPVPGTSPPLRSVDPMSMQESTPVQATSDGMPSSNAAAPSSDDATTTARAREFTSMHDRRVLGAVVLVLLSGIAFATWTYRDRPDRVADARPASTVRTPGPAAVGPVVPGPATTDAPTAPDVPAPATTTIAMVVDDEVGADSRIVDDLRRWVAPAAGLDVRARPSARWTDGLAAAAADPASSPRLAIVRYDALRSARAQARVSPRIVTPLFTEPIHVLVRRDSPMRYLHEIRGRRINVGPAGGARALTATKLVEGLFGTTGLPERADFGEPRAALARLVDGDGLDAIVLRGGDLRALRAASPSAFAADVRVLALDRNQPATRRAERLFLPTIARADASGGVLSEDQPALGEMTFLVATGAADASADARLGALVRSLCAALPTLRRDGDPRWRDAVVGVRLDVGWPDVPAATAALGGCANPASSAASPDAATRSNS